MKNPNLKNLSNTNKKNHNTEPKKIKNKKLP